MPDKHTFYLLFKELENTVERLRPSVSELNNDILAVKQLVARSRPGVVRSHPDVQRLEKDVDAITARWENLSIQMAERFVFVGIPTLLVRVAHV